LQGFEANWTIAAEEVAKPSSRWALIGNAVSVPVAEWLGKRLMTPADYDEQRDSGLSTDASWPRAARFDGKKRFAVAINDFPIWKERSPLVDFLEHPGKPLSIRATRGFLSRTERAKLRFPEGFQRCLRDHLSAMEAEMAFALAAE
jgi:DNA (cytosine-5)-methyltransferase 1